MTLPEPQTIERLQAIAARLNAPNSWHADEDWQDHVEDDVRWLLAQNTELRAENDVLKERIVTVDIDGREIRYDKLAEAEAALASIEEANARLEVERDRAVEEYKRTAAALEATCRREESERAQNTELREALAALTRTATLWDNEPLFATPLRAARAVLDKWKD